MALFIFTYILCCVFIGAVVYYRKCVMYFKLKNNFRYHAKCIHYYNPHNLKTIICQACSYNYHTTCKI